MITDAEYPIIFADTGITAKLATNGYLIAPRAKSIVEVVGLQQRFTNDGLVPDRQLTEQWQTLIRATLVLLRAADGDVFVAVAPILRQILENPFWAFHDHEEMKVIASLYHYPSIFAPRIGIFDEEVQGEACPHVGSRRDLPVTLSVTSYGQIETGRLRHDIGFLFELRITPIHIAVLAALSLLWHPCH